MRRYEILSSELSVTKNCNLLLSERIVWFETNGVNNAQYHCRKSLDINPVSASISNEALETNIFEVPSLTGHDQQSPSMSPFRKKETVIVKFKCKKFKPSIHNDRRNLHNKSDVITQLKFSGRLFILDSMCSENHKLAYKYRHLKNAGKIHSTWFWNNYFNVKLDERSQPLNIHHVIDTENFHGVDNLEEFINNTSF